MSTLAPPRPGAAQPDKSPPAEAKRFDEKLRRAEEHRESRERQNANRTKPRGAPLPPLEPAAKP